MSDTDILLTIIIFFVALGVLLPFIHAAFDEQVTDLNTQGVEFASGQGFSEDSVSILGIVTSILTMFFWTFGNIPVIIDLLLFVPIRIIFMILLFKLIRGVGG
ncbi:hypothetical protein LCGC14_0636230 [marine sediment metagenome]|uniref:Uncharacterized protein n=1 Tax=marine sediment metagenome TaxID=412755 RepID=A0A0F9R0I4_9ZZZZ